MAQQIRFRFDTHGLGDCCHCATVLQLYIKRGYDVQIQAEDNKRWMWEAAGIPIYNGPEQLPLHPYYYPGEFWDLSTPDHVGSKIAHLVRGVDASVLPRLDLTAAQMWQEICRTEIDLAGHVTAEAHRVAEEFIDGLPRPIFGLHSRGTNWSAEKSIPDGVAFESIMELLRKTRGSVIVLDFDARAPSLAGDPRCRTILPDGRISGLDRIAALLLRLDLLIGIDSGPFHLASMMPTVRSLGVFRKIPPVRCCIPTKSATYLVPGRDHQHWQRRLNDSVNWPAVNDVFEAGPHWNFIEYRGDEPTAQEITDVAIDLLLPPATPPGASPETQAEFDQVKAGLPGPWLYRRRGSDERIIELKADQTIGVGAAGCERFWRLIAVKDSKPLLAIYGDDRSETCHLTRLTDDTYQGQWNEHERMAIDLVRVPQFVAGLELFNGVERVFRVPQINAASLIGQFPNYDPSWSLPIGTRGNGAAWLLDPKVPRSDLDSCNEAPDGTLLPYVDHEDWIFPFLDVPAGSVCLDLASFVGTVAVWWARRGVNVIAVEPCPTHRTLLHRNLALNDVTNRVDVIPKAFGFMKGTARMWSHVGGGAATHPTEGDVEVEVTTIDAELLPVLDRLDLIKLDVEGAECDVIEGARETIRRFRPRMIIEVHGHYPGRDQNDKLITEQLKSLGYSFRPIWVNQPKYFYLDATFKG